MRRTFSLLLALALALCPAPSPAEEAAVPGENAAPAAVPADSSTRAWPVAAKRGVYVENGDARPVYFRLDGRDEPLVCWIVPGGRARLRLEIAAGDDPDAVALYDPLGSAILLKDLYDPARGAFVCGQEAQDGSGGEACRYCRGLLADSALGADDPRAVEYLLVPDEEALAGAEEALRAAGRADVRREDGEPVRPGDPPQAYVLHVADQYGSPVPGVYLNFCTDAACSLAVSGGDGTLVFSGMPCEYHVQLLMVPEGYSFDEGFEMNLGPAYGEWQLRVRRD